MNRGIATVLTSLALAFTLNAAADDQGSSLPEGVKRLGFVEWVVLDDPELRLKARLDTGANTSSLHATAIETFNRKGEEWVRFDLPLDHHKETDNDAVEATTLTFERPVERTVLVKRKGAESQRRHVVKMDFCINGASHEAQFSLTDRSRFKYPALLGRRFMAGQYVIDSEDSFLAESECDHSPLQELAENNG